LEERSRGPSHSDHSPEDSNALTLFRTIVVLAAAGAPGYAQAVVHIGPLGRSGALLLTPFELSGSACVPRQRPAVVEKAMPFQ